MNLITEDALSKRGMRQLVWDQAYAFGWNNVKGVMGTVSIVPPPVAKPCVVQPPPCTDPVPTEPDTVTDPDDVLFDEDIDTILDILPITEEERTEIKEKVVTPVIELMEVDWT